MVGFGRDPRKLERAVELGAIDSAAASLPEALDGAELCFACAPVGALPGQVRAALDAAGDGHRGDRRGLHQGRADATPSTTRASSAAIRSPARRPRESSTPAPTCSRARVWYLTPHEQSEGLLYERLHRFVVDARAPGPWRSIRTRTTGSWRCSATCRTCSPTCSSRRPRSGSRARRGAAPGRPELPRRHPRGRRQHRHVGRHLPVQPRGDRRGDPRLRRASSRRWPTGSRAARAFRTGTTAPARTGARCSRRTCAGGPVHELRLTVPNRPGIVAQVALELGRAGVNIVDMALAPAADMRSGAMTLWVAGDDEADARPGADRRAGLPGRRGVTAAARFEPSGAASGRRTPRRRTSRSRTAQRCSARCATSP